MFLVKCPNCRNNMKYNPRSKPKKKKCVYCGHTFSVHPNQRKSRIIN